MAKCDVLKCKAACCYNVPMIKGYFTVYKRKIVTPIIELIEREELDEQGRKLYLPITDYSFRKNKCPFLRADCRCNIYDERPHVCRIYGTPPDNIKSVFLECGFLNGKQYSNNIDNEQKLPDGLEEMLNMFILGKKIL